MVFAVNVAETICSDVATVCAADSMVPLGILLLLCWLCSSWIAVMRPVNRLVGLYEVCWCSPAWKKKVVYITPSLHFYRIGLKHKESEKCTSIDDDVDSLAESVLTFGGGVPDLLSVLSVLRTAPTRSLAIRDQDSNRLWANQQAAGPNPLIFSHELISTYASASRIVLSKCCSNC